MQARNEDRSLGELFSDLARDMGLLVRQEITLAGTELTRSASRAGREIGLLAVGALIAYAGVLGIGAALILALAQAGMQWWQAALLVGVVAAIIGALLASRSLAALKRMDLAPRRTMDSLKEDTQWAKEQIS